MSLRIARLRLLCRRRALDYLAILEHELSPAVHSRKSQSEPQPAETGSKLHLRLLAGNTDCGRDIEIQDSLPAREQTAPHWSCRVVKQSETTRVRPRPV